MILCFSIEDEIYMCLTSISKQNPADARKKSKLVANSILLSTDQ